LRRLARHITVQVGWGARAVLASGLCLAALVTAVSAASAAVASRALRAAAFTTRIPRGVAGRHRPAHLARRALLNARART